MNCLHCDKRLDDNHKKYCSVNCRKEYYKENDIMYISKLKCYLKSALKKIDEWKEWGTKRHINQLMIFKEYDRLWIKIDKLTIRLKNRQK
jgi:hypothetical protein